MKHEGWDEVTSVPTSRNLESRIGTNQHASAKEPPTEADALSAENPARLGVLHRGWGLRKVLTGASKLKLSVASIRFAASLRPRCTG